MSREEEKEDRKWELINSIENFVDFIHHHNELDELGVQYCHPDNPLYYVWSEYNWACDRIDKE